MARSASYVIACSGPSACGSVNKTSGLCLVRNRPSEIDFDLNELAIAEGEDLGVPKPSARNRTSLVGHENTIAIGHHVDETEPFYPLAVRPATFEIGRPVDSMIQRAREVEVGGDQRFDRRTILGHVRLITGAGKSNVSFFIHVGIIKLVWISASQ